VYKNRKLIVKSSQHESVGEKIKKMVRFLFPSPALSFCVFCVLCFVVKFVFVCSSQFYDIILLQGLIRNNFANVFIY